MKTQLRIIVLVIAIGSITSLGAAESPGSQSGGYKQLIEDFFKRLATGDAEKAVTEFFKTNPWQFQKKAMVEDFKSKFATLPDMVGKYVDHEVVKARLITSRLGYIQAVVSFERQPVLFSFTVHKPADKWQAITVNVNFNTDEFVPELAK